MLSKLQAAQAAAGLRSRGRGAIFVTALASALAVAPALPATAGDGKDTFEGSCEFPVRVTFDPPLTNSSRRTHAEADGRGRCSGTWTTAAGRERTLDDARVVYHAESDGRQSCAASEGPTGDGFLRYREHTIKFTFSESRAGTTARVELDGKRGGAFEGTANASGDEDPVEIAEKCTSTGLRQAGATITGSTAPEISG